MRNQMFHIACSAIWLTIGSGSLSCLASSVRHPGQPTSDRANAATLRASQWPQASSATICAAVQWLLQVFNRAVRSRFSRAGLTAATKTSGSIAVDVCMDMDESVSTAGSLCPKTVGNPRHRPAILISASAECNENVHIMPRLEGGTAGRWDGFAAGEGSE